VNAIGGRISQATIDAVRERADLVELVEARTGPGRRSAGQVMLRCPFHDERTPSFHVNPAEKVYICFGCGEKGGLFDFVQKLEHASFPEAVEWLADRYGIEIEREDLSPADRDRLGRAKQVDGLLDDVASFYERFLERAEEAQPARDYLAERGISAASIERFRLGFAPSDWDRVARAAQQKGYSPELLLDAGVSSQGRRGPIDRFRGRITFPLCDARGRVRGFGARVMPGGEGPKYLNSPESEIFKKSRILYGLHLARPAIAKRHRAIVVEGYTDVIALHAAGFEEAVAAMGTSLTEDGVRELRRLADAVVLCFDADAAGQEAALRGMAIAERSGLRVRIVALPAGEDPADILARGAEAFEAALEGALPVLAFRIGRALQLATSEEGPDAAYAACRAILADAAPGPERDEQVRRVAGALRLASDSAAALVPGRLRMPRGVDTSVSRARRDQREVAYQRLLAACLVARELPDDQDASPLASWVRDRAQGRDVPVPTGFEGDAAQVLSYAADFGEGDDARAEARVAVANLRVGRRITEINDELAFLKAQRESPDNNQETSLRRQLELQRERAELERQFRASAI
jgi:DNA primase